MVGIVDQALIVGGQDDLDISAYHEALVDFIKKTDTPMTIGVQGEWGSGKTSLLNQIWSKLEESNNEHQDDENFLQIWVNSWEHSLLCSPEECLLKIVNEIIQELLQADVDKNNKDKVIVATGKIVPLGEVQNIKMPMGGIANNILVDEGDYVELDQVLIELKNDSNLARVCFINSFYFCSNFL